MTKYQVFLIIVFLFFFGSGGGWVLELFFRRFFSGANPERKWLNPGFLFGPCVPLYGFGTVVLFVLSEFESQIFGQFGGSWWYYLVMFFGMALAMTALEYIAGLMSLKVMHLRLWDYTNCWGNIQGLICPLATVTSAVSAPMLSTLTDSWRGPFSNVTAGQNVPVPAVPVNAKLATNAPDSGCSSRSVLPASTLSGIA